MKKLWFKAKKYGWGWCPCSLEGWTATLLAIIIYIFAFLDLIKGRNIVLNSIIIILDFFVLFFVCYKKGEKPRWRWGR